MYGYVSIKPDFNTRAIIARICNRYELPLMPIQDLHITLIYDKTNPLEDDKDNNKDLVFDDAKVVGYKIMGTGKWRALTLIIDSPLITYRHEELMKLGFNHSFPSYIPHLSIAYQPDESSNIKEKMDEAMLDFRNVSLTFFKEKWEPIKED